MMERSLALFDAAMCLCSSAQADTAGKIAVAASVTTISVNASTIAKWVRHPKRTAKKTAKAAKDIVKGKN